MIYFGLTDTPKSTMRTWSASPQDVYIISWIDWEKRMALMKSLNRYRRDGQILLDPSRLGGRKRVFSSKEGLEFHAIAHHHSWCLIIEPPFLSRVKDSSKGHPLNPDFAIGVATRRTAKSGFNISMVPCCVTLHNLKIRVSSFPHW